MQSSGSLSVEWDDEIYAAAVRSGLQLIRDGKVDKIVAARDIHAQSNASIDPMVLMDALVRLYADCYLYFHASSPGVYFISATPERLARTADGRFSTNAVAGTMPRNPGELEDAIHERMLLESEKNLAEHTFVLDMLKETAAGFCSEVASEETRVVTLRNVFHLLTPVSGTLAEGKTLADAVAALHPTPAVCGAPRAAALQGIRDIENFKRGLYAGCAGWMDAAGNGEGAVTIRSALIRNNSARIFAGAGIVRDSNVDEEVRETRLKAQPLIEAMG